MEEDSAGQSNIFAYEPAKPYVSDDNAKLGSASGGIFAAITVAATFAVRRCCDLLNLITVDIKVNVLNMK